MRYYLEQNDGCGCNIKAFANVRDAVTEAYYLWTRLTPKEQVKYTNDKEGAIFWVFKVTDDCEEDDIWDNGYTVVNFADVLYTEKTEGRRVYFDEIWEQVRKTEAVE